MGGIKIGNIKSGVGKKGVIGYWRGENFEGKGYMKEEI